MAAQAEGLESGFTSIVKFVSKWSTGSMSTVVSTYRGNLSKFDLGILALHALGAAVTGIIGFIEVDPDWAAVQRIVIVMMVGLWAGGIVVMAAIARRVSRQWARAAILLAGPFIGLGVLVASSTLG